MPRTFRVVVARVTPSDVVPGGRIASDVVARALRDAGFEVIHGPPADEPDCLAATTLQEDADAVALVTDDAAAVVAALASWGIDDVPVVVTDPEATDIVDRVQRGLGLDGVS